MQQYILFFRDNHCYFPAVHGCWARFPVGFERGLLQRGLAGIRPDVPALLLQLDRHASPWTLHPQRHHYHHAKQQTSGK